MKKLALTITLLLGMTLGAFAEWNSYQSNWFFFNWFNPDEDEEEATGLFENDEVNAFMWNNVIETPTFSSNNGGGGLFGRGRSMNTGLGYGFRTGTGTGLFLPNVHGSNEDQAPLGSGVVVLLGMGAAYLVAKKRKEI